ncbi:MAG: aldo/keto reductase [Calditrichota bacterium]
MKKRSLGKEFTISEVGLGCWQFGGDFGPMDEQFALDILAASADSSVDFWDTADVYGSGKSERLIGEFRKSNNDHSAVVATKFGRDGSVFPDNYSYDALMHAIDLACDRIGTESIDLLQLHCLPEAVLRNGEIFNWLRKAKAAGRIRAFGASVETVAEGLLCLEQEGITSLQVIFNIFRQKPLFELLPEAEKKNVGIIVRLPLASGLLAGKYTSETTFAETDHRNYNRDGEHFNVGETFAGLPFSTGVLLADEVKKHVPAGMTMAQMSLRWLLDHSAVSTIIPGASSVKQARENAAVSQLPSLPDTVHQALKEIYIQQVEQHIRGPY